MRVLSVLSRMPVDADIDFDKLIKTLRAHSTYLGTAWTDDTLQTALNLGDTLADQPALANLADTLAAPHVRPEVEAGAYHPDRPDEPPKRGWRHWFDRKRSSR